MTSGEIDRTAWAAHLRADLRLWADVPQVELVAWADLLAAESSAYWHGMSGRLAERLGITTVRAWSPVVRLHRPQPATSLGDSSLDLVPYILARCGVMGALGFWSAADEADCRAYFERGREVGCHRAAWE